MKRESEDQTFVAEACDPSSSEGRGRSLKMARPVWETGKTKQKKNKGLGRGLSAIHMIPNGETYSGHSAQLG